MHVIIRDEIPNDIATIRTITTDAFADMVHSSHTEAAIIDALRKAGVLTLSIVAEEADEIVGHVAFSPVRIDGRDLGWHGLGPISVRPDRQGNGIGSLLVREGLQRLKAMGSHGCVLLGEPGYYRRFGFTAQPDLILEGVPPEYFQALGFGGDIPAGTVAYHPAFEAS